MKQQMRAGGRRIAGMVVPRMLESSGDYAAMRRTVEDLQKQVKRLRARVVELEREVQENRRLNRRLAELTDIVQELLVPVGQRDQGRLDELLEKYSERL